MFLQVLPQMRLQVMLETVLVLLVQPFHGAAVLLQNYRHLVQELGHGFLEGQVLICRRRRFA